MTCAARILSDERQAAMRFRCHSLIRAFALIFIVAISAATARAQVYVTKWGTIGFGDGQFNIPSQVATDAAGNVYVADRGNNRIQKFSRTGAYITQWGTLGSGDGQFNSPSGIATDAAGNVFVADFSNFRIQKFTGGGVYLSQWGTGGSGNGQFIRPFTLATNTAGEVYVVDYFNMRVQRFTGAGVYIGQFGTQGMGNGQFNFPSGIATDNDGNVYVGDILNQRIQKFSASGTYITQWGSFGSGDGQFGNNGILAGPYGVATDVLGNVYVADGGNSRIQKFSGTGTYLGQWGSVGSGDGQFAADAPAFVARSVDGYGVYTSDEFNGRIQLFAGPLTITSIADVRNDQGRQVWIHFSRSGLDAIGSATPITQYEVYRRVDPLPLAQTWTAAQGAAPGDQTNLAGWAYVMSMPAHGDESYTAVVPTLADSTDSGIQWSAFLIRAATASPYVTYSSLVDSGYSVDNLPPAPPTPFTAAYAGGATHLHWGVNTESDLRHYRLYRGSSSGFVPGPGNLIVASSDTGYADVGSIGGYYKLAAVDVNGNESSYVLITPEQTADVPFGGLLFGLDGVRPNPSDGTRATIAFRLPSASPARLEIVDVGGRRVMVRDVASFGPGSHTLDVTSGRRFAPGLYLVRLSQGVHRAVARMVVIE